MVLPNLGLFLNTLRILHKIALPSIHP
jgi:hypothetical protein